MSAKNPLKSSAHDYFILSEDGGNYICQCEIDIGRICGTKISSFGGKDKNAAPTRTFNLKRHLARSHPEIMIIVEEKDKRHAATTASGIQRPTKSSDAQKSISSFFKSDKVTITMTADNFKKHLIDLVVQNGLPLRLFSQPAFQGISGEMATKLGVSLDRQNVRNIIIEEAKSKKEAITKTLQNKFVFLKMDAATRHRVNYFAINVRFVNDSNQTITETLAVKDTKAHHESVYLQSLIEDVLKEFEIKKSQVLCIVTDNASNMVKTIERLNEANQFDSDTAMDVVDSDSNSTEGDSIVEHEMEELDHPDEVIDDILEESSKLSLIKHMRCAVHTLQLAIRDGLKEKRTASLISKIRQIVTACRTPKIGAILKRRLGKGALIDQVTRWGSTYMMVRRLLELKTSLEDLDNPNVVLSTAQWSEVENLERALSLPFLVTKKLQAEDLTAGAFVYEWKNLAFQLGQLGGSVANGITSSMAKREALLFENDLLLAAVFVDPRNRVLLTPDQMIQAKAALCDIATRMRGLLPEDLQQTQGNLADAECHSSSSNDETSFEKYLDRREKDLAKRKRVEKTAPVNVQLAAFKKLFNTALEEIEKYDRTCKMPLHELIDIYPDEIRSVATIVTALPPTQVSVERLFSALKLIKSDLRSSMKEDLAEAILFLRNVN